MPNSPDIFETIAVSEQKAESFVARLPTNMEIAQKGAENFEKVVQRLPDRLKLIFLNSIQIQGCFIGVTPEVGSEEETPLNNLGTVQVSELVEILSQEAPEMEMANGGQILINIEAAQRVIRNYPEYFPEGIVYSLRSWLVVKKSEWCHYSLNREDQREIRWGLLSGYPLTSVLCFCRSKGKNEGFNINNKYGNIWYKGSDPVKDGEYVKQLDEIFDGCGIKEVVGRYLGTQTTEKLYKALY